MPSKLRRTSLPKAKAYGSFASIASLLVLLEALSRASFSSPRTQIGPLGLSGDRFGPGPGRHVVRRDSPRCLAPNPLHPLSATRKRRRHRGARRARGTGIGDPGPPTPSSGCSPPSFSPASCSRSRSTGSATRTSPRPSPSRSCSSTGCPRPWLSRCGVARGRPDPPRPLDKVVFNAAQLAISWVAAGIALDAVGGSGLENGEDLDAADLPAIAFSAAVSSS